MKPNGVIFFASGGASSEAPHQPGGRFWLRRLACILYNFINFHAKVLYKHTEYTGSLGYNSVCYITSRIRWVFNVLGYGGKEKKKKKKRKENV